MQINVISNGIFYAWLGRDGGNCATGRLIEVIRDNIKVYPNVCHSERPVLTVVPEGRRREGKELQLNQIETDPSRSLRMTICTRKHQKPKYGVQEPNRTTLPLTMLYSDKCRM